MRFVPSHRPAWKPSYQLIWTNAAAARILAQVDPYLRVKAVQARLMMRFQEEIRKSRRKRDSLGRLLPISRQDQTSRDRYYRALKALNHAGSRGVDGRRNAFTRNREGSRTLRRVSLQYFAGFIDGEGSLMLAKVKRAVRLESAYVPRMSVDNTNKAVLRDIQRQYGGILFEQSPRKTDWKRSYKLVWTGNRVEAPLRLIAQHLHIKRRRAKTLLRFIDYKKRAAVGQVPRVAPPSDINRLVWYQEALYRQMRELNTRGLAGR